MKFQTVKSSFSPKNKKTEQNSIIHLFKKSVNLKEMFMTGILIHFFPVGSRIGDPGPHINKMDIKHSFKHMVVKAQHKSCYPHHYFFS